VIVPQLQLKMQHVAALLQQFLAGLASEPSLVSGRLCSCSFVEPLAAGSGIPEVKTYLNGVHIKVGRPALPFPTFLPSVFVVGLLLDYCWMVSRGIGLQMRWHL
jgi:hypothetical protein